MRNSLRRRARVLVAVCLASSAAACSSVTRLETSTGQRAGVTAGAGGQLTPTGDDAGTALQDAGSTSGGSPTAAATGGGGGGASVGASQGATAGPGGATATPSGAKAGSCARPVRIGASYSSDLSTGLAAVGNPAAAAQAGNYTQTVKQSYQLGVDDLNKRGGLHGCPVQLAFHDFKALASDGFDGQSQQECTDFVQDQKVDIVFTGGLENQVLVQCLDRAGVPLNIGYFSADAPDYKRYANTLLGQDALTVSRFGPFIDAWSAAGYFDPRAKVGILAGDDGTGSRTRLVDSIWTPKLKAMGINPVVFRYRVINGYNDVSRVTSLFSQAVLQFKAAGVDHVIIPPDQNNGLIFFTQVAESQGYRPRYALTSESGAAGWYSVPAGQRPRAVAVSYRVTDVILDPKLVDQNEATPTRVRCNQMYRPRNMIVDFRWCDFLQFLQDALVKEPYSRDALRRGVEALGTSHRSAIGFGGTRFGADAHDGLAQIRTMAWDDGANQWKYVSAPTAVP